jgi:hypothetical protein
MNGRRYLGLYIKEILHIGGYHVEGPFGQVKNGVSSLTSSGAPVMRAPAIDGGDGLARGVGISTPADACNRVAGGDDRGCPNPMIAPRRIPTSR